MPLEYGRVVFANTVGTRVGPAARLTEIDYHPTWTPRAQGEAEPARGCLPVCRLVERASRYLLRPRPSRKKCASDPGTLRGRSEDDRVYERMGLEHG